jgi:acetyltransferase-like isoleucine patch superfamily enzyme
MLRAKLRDYLKSNASSVGRYVVQELVLALCGWIPSLPGLAIRALIYKLIMRISGVVAIESGVRLSYVENIKLGRHVYLDRGSYLHACPGGIEIGDGAYIMHNAELHVFNFRDLPHAFIRIGPRTFVGESVVIRGQGGVTIGESVLIGPGAQILAVNHQYGDPSVPIMDQSISGQGIVVEDGAWIAAGAVILDGVRVGRNAVVGANAVVTRDVPPHSVVVGVPARVVRSVAAGQPATQAAVVSVLDGSARAARQLTLSEDHRAPARGDARSAGRRSRRRA